MWVNMPYMDPMGYKSSNRNVSAILGRIPFLNYLLGWPTGGKGRHKLPFRITWFFLCKWVVLRFKMSIFRGVAKQDFRDGWYNPCEDPFLFQGMYQESNFSALTVTVPCGFPEDQKVFFGHVKLQKVSTLYQVFTKRISVHIKISTQSDQNTFQEVYMVQCCI